MNYAQNISRIYPLVTRTSFHHAKRSYLSSSHLGGYHAIAARTQTRTFHRSTLVQDVNPNNSSSKPPSYPAESVDSKRTPDPPSKPGSNTNSKSKAKAKAKASTNDKNNHSAQPPASQTSSPSASTSKKPSQPKKAKKSKVKNKKWKQSPADLAWEQNLWSGLLEMFLGFTLFEAFLAAQKREAKRARKKARSLDLSPESTPTEPDSDSKDSKNSDKSKPKGQHNKKDESDLTLAQIIQSLNDQFPDIVLPDDLETGDGTNTDSSSDSPAEILQAFLESDPWDRPVESYEFESDLSVGRNPGKSEWERRHSLGALLNSSLERDLEKAGVIKGGMVSTKKLAEYLAKRAD
ncbi:hypothetical protein BDV93DRAFT_524542, partial [Ceratobasidium sp. AG-I]